MMLKSEPWQPKQYDQDPMVNAVLNLAAETHAQALSLKRIAGALNEQDPLRDLPDAVASIADAAAGIAAQLEPKPGKR